MKRLLLDDFYHSKRWYPTLPAILFDALENAFLAGFDHILVTPAEYSLITSE